MVVQVCLTHLALHCFCGVRIKGVGLGIRLNAGDMASSAPCDDSMPRHLTRGSHAFEYVRVHLITMLIALRKLSL